MRCRATASTDAGPRTAPDLSDVGLARAPAALQRTLLDPSSAMLPINRPVRIVMKDGRTITGRRLNEDTYTVQLIDERGAAALDCQERRPHARRRDEVDDAVVCATLTADEIADVVAYLLTLKDLKP